jgi:hypothetical protein
MRMSPERQHAFDRLLRRQRIGRMLKLALPFVIGIGLLAGLIWLRKHGSTVWIWLTIAAAAGLAKPALMAIRVREQRRRRDRMD